MAVLPNIGERLPEYLKVEAQRPFNWQRHNCAHFVGGWIAFWRGIDPWEIITRAERDTRLRLCTELTFPELADRAAIDLQLPLRDGSMQIGDIVMISASIGSPWKALGIAMPPFVVVLAEQGLLYTRREPLISWALQ